MNSSKLLVSCVLSWFFVMPLTAGGCMSSCLGLRQEMSLMELCAKHVIVERLVVNEIPVIAISSSNRKYYYMPVNPKKPENWYFVGHSIPEVRQYGSYLQVILMRSYPNSFPG